MLKRVILALVAAAICAGPALADDSGLNPEGFWTVGRGDADSGSCVASLSNSSGGIFALTAMDGAVTISVLTPKPMRAGKTGMLSTEAYAFEFEPALNEARDLLSFDDFLNDRALAALRLARQLSVRLDKRAVFTADVAATGMDNALDAVVACSQGQKGWWGPGVEPAQLERTRATLKASLQASAGPVTNAEGYWAVQADDSPGVCIARGRDADGREIRFLAAMGKVGMAILGKGLPAGRTGLVETDGGRFAFKPGLDGREYLYFQDPMEAVDLETLRQAKELRISVDGRTVTDMGELDAGGFAGMLDAVAACSRSEKGWWGEGAKSP